MSDNQTQYGTLNGTVVSDGTLEGTVVSDGSLQGEIYIPSTVHTTCLPNVKEKDDGKVLKVQGGAWSVGDDNEATPLSNLEIEELIRNFK